jgi:hypothetical protein
VRIDIAGQSGHELYLVDLGELVPVRAVNARDAFSMAVIAHTQCADHPTVYQINASGEVTAIFTEDQPR